MIKKQVAVILLIVALILASVAVITYFVHSDDKLSTANGGEGDNDSGGNGKIGINILPPTIEDKDNGS